MFNNSACGWWSGHGLPGHYDHYIKGTNIAGVIECARALALGIQDLVHLKNLYIGYYFVPFEAVNTHRSAGDHIRPIKDTVKWIDGVHTQSIVQFNANYGQSLVLDVSSSSQKGASVLAAQLPQLETASFSSFVAEQRVAPSEWVVGRVDVPSPPSGEQQVWTRTKRSGTPCSSGKRLSFRRSVLR
ncbi:F-box-like domain protein [Ceratobasidium sp. AG-Ba]|nr:F-box-like domain protein [Ceratobasidium sp. AG-Ba]